MVLRFGDCELDAERYTLRRQGRPVAVQPRVLDLLLHLARARDRVVAREELHAAVWKGVVVSETALSYAVKEARRAIGDDGQRQALIETVRGRGFRFVAPVSLSRPVESIGDAALDPFVGRSDVLATLASELDAAARGSGRLVLLEGEPGIGKSRTLEELTDRARARGFRTLFGRGAEGAGAPAYWPWTQALRRLLESADRAALPADAASVIAHVMPELRALLPEAAGEAPPGMRDVREAHFRLFDALARVWETVARREPVLLALDDLHEVDRASLSLLAYVAREIEHAPVLVAATCRGSSLLSDPERSRQIGELRRAPRTRSLRLSGLEPAEVAELVETLRGQAPGEAELGELMERTGGNPFFVREIVTMPGPIGGGEELPETVRQAVLRHLDALPESARRLLGQAAVLGRRFEPEVLAALADLPPEKLVGELDPAVAADVLEPEGPGSSSYQFAHALIPEALGASLPAGELRLLHARAAEVLEADGPSRPDRVARIAQHLVRAVPAASRERAIAACRGAAREAAERLAHDEAVALLEQALELAAGGPCDEALEIELLLSLAEARLVTMQLGLARQASTRAADLARRIGDPAWLARSALAFAAVQDEARTDPTIVDLLEQALRALPARDAPLLARLESRLAEALCHGTAPQMKRAVTLGRGAVARARRCGDPFTLGVALKAQHWSAWTPDNFAEREAIAEELLDLAVATGSPDLEHEALCFGIANALERGDRAAVETACSAYAALAHRVRRLRFDWHLEHQRVMRHLLDRDAEAAEPALERARRLGQRSQYDVASTYFGVQLYGIRSEQGRLRELEPMMRRMAREHPRTPWRLALACDDARAGRREAGWAALSDFLGNGRVGLRRDLSFLVAAWYLAELCALLQAEREAGVLADALAPYAERHVVVGVGILYLGPVAQALSCLADARNCAEATERWSSDARVRDLRRPLSR